VVSGIVGIRRFRIRASGQADHAGTTPMTMRRDAGRALYRLAGGFDAAMAGLGAADTVWNIGAMTFRPGAPNVVPSEAEMMFECRDLSTEVLDRVEAALADAVRRTDGAGGVRVTLQALARTPPTLMSDSLAALIRESAVRRGVPWMDLPSGAGHDATVLGRVMPSAMVFVPSIGGRSHDLVENTDEADIVLGCEVLAEVVERMESAA